MQDIDARKPLSGRIRQLENPDNSSEDSSWNSKQGQGHDRETLSKGKSRETAAIITSPHEFPRRRLVDGYSPFPLERAVSLPSEVQSLAAVTAATSTSPPRGLMLTSQGEVNERLSKMKETFLKSLEGLGSGNVTRRKEGEKTFVISSSSRTSSTVTPFEQTSINDSPQRSTSSQDVSSPLVSRGMNLACRFPSREQPVETMMSPGPYDYGPSGRGLGVTRGRYASASSSMLGSSDVVGMSQGSEEVIGRMDLYDECRRTGYQG